MSKKEKFKFDNKTTLDKDLVDSLLINMEHIFNTNNIEMPLLWSSIEKIKVLLYKNWDHEYFRRYWFDSLVSEYANFLWNNIWKNIRKVHTDKKADKITNNIYYNYLGIYE